MDPPAASRYLTTCMFTLQPIFKTKQPQRLHSDWEVIKTHIQIFDPEWLDHPKHVCL